jgi:hypothetical protein
VNDDATVREALLNSAPAASTAEPDWADVLRRTEDPPAGRRSEARLRLPDLSAGDLHFGPPVVDCRA